MLAITSAVGPLNRTALAVDRTPVGQPPRARWAVAATAILVSLSAGAAHLIPSPTPSSAESDSVMRPATPEAAASPVLVLPTAPPPAPPGTAAQRDAVARYFEEVEGLEAQGKYWTDAQLLGKTVMDQALSGDAGGFDRLIAADEGIREAVARMDVPPPCSQHHSLTVDVLDQGLSLLREARAHALSEDGTSLKTILSTGLGIEARARAVDARAEDIKRQFGIVNLAHP